jgi:hypothetical protein
MARRNARQARKGRVFNPKGAGMETRLLPLRGPSSGLAMLDPTYDCYWPAEP